MRRLGLFAVLLSLVGLSTAVAASFDVQTEDIVSFSTSTSISVPAPPTALSVLYLNGAGLPAMLAEVPEAPDPSVNKKQLDQGTGDVQAQIDAARYHSWQTTPSPEGLRLFGPATLYLYQTGKGGPVRAGLFSCPADATPTSLLCIAVGHPATSDSAADTEVEADTLTAVRFGHIDATIPSTHSLRVQVMNQATHPKLQVQWGYKTNRESRLEITVVTGP